MLLQKVKGFKLLINYFWKQIREWAGDKINPNRLAMATKTRISREQQRQAASDHTRLRRVWSGQAIWDTAQRGHPSSSLAGATPAPTAWAGVGQVPDGCQPSHKANTMHSLQAAWYYVSNVRGSNFLFSTFYYSIFIPLELISQLCERYVIYPLSYHQ